jgi:DNA polymerase III gamma/tau subunit
MWVDKYRPTKFTDLLGEEVRMEFLLAIEKGVTSDALYWLASDRGHIETCSAG